MKILGILILLTSCSLLKSNPSRCLDIVEEFGTIDLQVKVHGKEQLYCGPKGKVEKVYEELEKTFR